MSISYILIWKGFFKYPANIFFTANDRQLSKPTGKQIDGWKIKSNLGSEPPYPCGRIPFILLDTLLILHFLLLRWKIKNSLNMLTRRWDGLINWLIQFTHLRETWEAGIAFIFERLGGVVKRVHSIVLIGLNYAHQEITFNPKSYDQNDSIDTFYIKFLKG